MPVGKLCVKKGCDMKWLPFQRRDEPESSADNTQQGTSNDSAVSFLSLSQRVQEINRLNQQHFLMKCDMQANFLSPLLSPAAILDIGCGTGRWAMEMAVQFATAQVIGIDIMTPTPFVSLGQGLDQVPPNIRFM